MATGKSHRSWHVEGEFFGAFENSEILDADLVVDADIEKSGRYTGLDLHIEGRVVVECDRCLSPLSLPVSAHPLFSIKFGDGPFAGTPVGPGEREVLILPDTDTDLDLSQLIYDYSCISLPLSRVHEDGDCDPDTVRFLNFQEDSNEEESSADADESPFAALKNLFDE